MQISGARGQSSSIRSPRMSDHEEKSISGNFLVNNLAVTGIWKGKLPASVDTLLIGK